MSASLRTSVGTTSAVPPALVISAAILSRFSLLRAAMTVLIPSAASLRTIASPSPVLAPVTIATRSRKLIEDMAVHSKTLDVRRSDGIDCALE